MRIALFGGTSDIGLAIVEELAEGSAAEIVLLLRAISASADSARERLSSQGHTVQTMEFDALDFESHPSIVGALFTTPVDVAIVAFGVLGDAAQVWRVPELGVQTVQVNATGAISVGIALGQEFSRQGGGTVILVSSMAGEKVRPSNFVYGLSKQAADEFYTQLDGKIPALRVLVVRPGFVSTKLTAGRQAALSTSPEVVATATVQALRRGKSIVRVPRIFGPLIGVYRHLPKFIRIRLSF